MSILSFNRWSIKFCQHFFSLLTSFFRIFFLFVFFIFRFFSSLFCYFYHHQSPYVNEPHQQINAKPFKRALPDAKRPRLKSPKYNQRTKQWIFKWKSTNVIQFLLGTWQWFPWNAWENFPKKHEFKCVLEPMMILLKHNTAQ